MIPLFSIRTHRILDLLLSIGLIAYAWLAEFPTDDPVVPASLMVAGIVLLTYGLFTRFQKVNRGSISLKAHMILDALLGLGLAATPWILSFASAVYKPHLIGGGILVFLALTSQYEFKKARRSSTDHRHIPM